ncbi:MAG: CsiV family protein [Woeseiaceae bacterium]
MTDLARKLTLLLFAFAAPTALLAQDELLDEEQPPIKRYTVELVVFTYTEDVSVGTEVFPPDIIESPTDENAAIAEVKVTKRARRHPDFIGYVPVLLDEKDFTMNDVVRRFELLDAYDPIFHVGWTQVGSPQADTPPLQLETFGTPPAGLNGSFTLYLGRYLHLVVDLAMDAPRSAYKFSFADQPELIEGPVRYRIQENRIIKNGETRYFDHPKFGVVAKVIRVEEIEDDEELPVQPPLVRRTAQ